MHFCHALLESEAPPSYCSITGRAGPPQRLRRLAQMTDKIWHSEPHSAPPSEGHFNYWPEGLLPLEIDDLGLGLASAPPAAGDATPTQPLHGSPEHEAALRKRKRERADQESVESILAQLGREEEDDSPYEDKRPQRTTSGSHKATAASAARNKACRERQRRERLNDRCGVVTTPGRIADYSNACTASFAVSYPFHACI